ncbi:putative ankyrin repeat protein [Trichoderma austrokoningii]
MAEDSHPVQSNVFEAIASADISGLKQILAAKEVDLEAREPAGRTALHLAVAAASADICQCLIDNGARLDAWTEQGEAVVHIAAKRGELDVLHAIMKPLEAVKPATQDNVTADDQKKDRTVHVDCLTQKHQMSPLYIAVALAHVKVVEALLDSYHADVNIIVGKQNIQRGTRTADALEAALQHPRDTCRSLLRILLQRGASLLNPSTGTVSQSLLLLVLRRGEDVLDIFAELDSEGFAHAINKYVWGESIRYKNALTSAIELGLEDTAFKLLSYGAPPKVEFDSSLEAKAKSSFFIFGKTPLQAAEDDFWQPILCAAHYEMPRLVMELLNRGADPNSRLTDHQARSLIWFRDCRSVLDLVRGKLAELRGWNKEDETLPQVLVGTPAETIQREGKENAITQLTKLYEEAEAKLISLGAEATDGLNLQDAIDAVSRRSNKRVQLHAPNPEAQAEISLPSHTSTKDIDFKKLETTEDGRMALLAACKQNDVALVKELTLGKWGVDLKFPPLSISEVSGSSKGPYYTAVTSRNYDLARIIVGIATVQHANFVDHESNGQASALADDQHSVESIKSVSAQVKSTTSARAIVRDSGAISIAEKQKDEVMLQFAIEMHYSFGLDQDDVKQSPGSVYHLMEYGDWPEHVIERVKATGAPFQHEVVQGKLKGRKKLDRIRHLSPLLRAAWSGNLNMVRFFLDKSKLMAAYKYFAARNDFSTNKIGSEQARADFIKTAEEWVDKEKNLVLHCAIMSRKAELVKLVLSARPELLEVRSIDGWTPLMTAAMCQQVESIRLLLEARADPFATDTFGRNMLHLFLVSPTDHYVYELETLSSFLRVVEKPVLQKLIEERCVDSPGGLTPLARWISSALKYAPNKLSIALLESCTTKAMEMREGRGYTPLHNVAVISLENPVRPFIEKAPHVLFYEDMAGKTPYDLIIEKQLYGYLEHLMPSYTQTERYPGHSLVHHPLFAFDADYKGALQEKQPYRVWEICQDMVKSMQPGPHHRKLLTDADRIEISQLSKDKKISKKPKGDQHDVVTLAIYKPGYLCW